MNNDYLRGIDLDSLFFNVKKVLSEDYYLYILIGARGMGKTYSCIDMIFEKWDETGEESVYLRRRDCDMIDNFKLFDGVIEKHPGRSFKFKGNIWYCDSKPVCYCKCLKDAKRGGNYNKVNWIIYDEAIPDRGTGSYISQEFSVLMNLWETVNRLRTKDGGHKGWKEQSKLILLGNNSARYNLWTNKLNIHPQNRIFKKDYIYYAELPNNEEFKALREKSPIGKILSNTDEYKHMYNNEDTSISYDSVTGFPPNVSPLCNIDICGYTLGYYKQGQNIYVSTKPAQDVYTYIDDKSMGYYYYGRSLEYLDIKFAFLENMIFFKDKKSADIFYDTFRII